MFAIVQIFVHIHKYASQDPLQDHRLQAHDI